MYGIVQSSIERPEFESWLSHMLAKRFGTRDLTSLSKQPYLRKEEGNNNTGTL